MEDLQEVRSIVFLLLDTHINPTYRSRKVRELVPSYVEIPYAVALHNLTRYGYLRIVGER